MKWLSESIDRRHTCTIALSSCIAQESQPDVGKRLQRYTDEMSTCRIPAGRLQGTKRWYRKTDNW